MNVTTAWTTTPSTHDPEDCYQSAHLEKKLFIALHLTVILIGTPSNLFFLYVSCQHIRNKNELGVYLFNLALSDLLFIMCLPVWIQFTLYDKWLYSSTVCTACIFLLFTNFYMSAILLCCIAVDRYLAVVHPLKFCTFRKRQTAVSISIAAWIFIIIFNAITVMLSSVYDENNSVCLDIFPLQKTQHLVNIARFVVGFFVPALVAGFCYWQICLEVRRNQALVLMERRRVFKLLGSVLLTLYLCFGPVHIMMILRVLLEQCPYPNWLFISYKLSIMLSMLNCLADPLLYCFTSRTGRDSASNVLLFLRRTWKRENQ
ncbi:psychosine receptor-like isoform X1 [Myxocyprinus asiaticus]|uniref:psychosine receptor-like isoform X1 n=1 Tax=Myxocyprinus asiaticus TaxID=70543 RepID=UPI002223255F|nr:psychosine receptor-like isoform X1 [Myxocyprinus asiaticus]